MMKQNLVEKIQVGQVDVEVVILSSKINSVDEITKCELFRNWLSTFEKSSSWSLTRVSIQKVVLNSQDTIDSIELEACILSKNKHEFNQDITLQKPKTGVLVILRGKYQNYYLLKRSMSFAVGQAAYLSLLYGQVDDDNNFIGDDVSMLTKLTSLTFPKVTQMTEVHPITVKKTPLGITESSKSNKRSYLFVHRVTLPSNATLLQKFNSLENDHSNDLYSGLIVIPSSYMRSIYDSDTLLAVYFSKTLENTRYPTQRMNRFNNNNVYNDEYKNNDIVSNNRQRNFSQFKPSTHVGELQPVSSGVTLVVKIHEKPSIKQTSPTLLYSALIGDDSGIVTFKLLPEQLRQIESLGNDIILRGVNVDMEDCHIAVVMDEYSQATRSPKPLTFIVNTNFDVSKQEYELVETTEKDKIPPYPKPHRGRGLPSRRSRKIY